MKLNTKKQDMRELSHKNYMNGLSYDLSPFMRLYFLTASSFFGEKAYYEKGTRGDLGSILSESLGYMGLEFTKLSSMDRKFAVEKAINDSLEYDAELTINYLNWLRNEANIRTTPQVGLAIAAKSPHLKGKGLIRQIGTKIMSRLDDTTSCLAYYLKEYGKPIPNSLKRALRDRIMQASEYEMAKYNQDDKEVSLKDVVFLTKAHSDAIQKLLEGKLNHKEDANTWESIISTQGSNKETWEKSIPLMGHMALLRNLNNFEKHNVLYDLYADRLLSGVEKGRQLPFRYYSAYQKISLSQNKELLEKCMVSSINNLPSFKGKTLVLVDNSGSARGATVSELSNVNVSDAGNLMGIFTCMVSENGDIGVFGDRLEIIPIAKNNSPLKTLSHVDKVGSGIGQSTENGIWLALDKIIRSKEHYDRIFIYSDMQAGHGGLYGIDSSKYPVFQGTSNSIDVPKLLAQYRQDVNPDCYVYCSQIGGYGDNILPEFYPKTFLLSGWSQEVLNFAYHMETYKDKAEEIFRKKFNL